MKTTLLVRWLLLGLTTLHSLTALSAGLSIEIEPASSTYSVGQTLYVSVRGGQPGTTYTVNALSGNPATGLSSVSITADQTGTNTITFGPDQTEAGFIVRFLAGSEGEGRILQVSSADQSETDQTADLTIIAAPTITVSPATGTYSEEQSVTVTVSGGIVGRDYVIKLYEGHFDNDIDLSDETTPASSQSTINTILWSANTTSAQFYVRFDEGSSGINRRLVVTDVDFSHLALSNVFTIGDCTPIVTVQSVTGGILATGGVLYEFMQVQDRVNGYEIRQTDTNTTGIFIPHKSGLFTVTVTGPSGCKSVVEATKQ